MMLLKLINYFSFFFMIYKNDNNNIKLKNVHLTRGIA